MTRTFLIDTDTASDDAVALMMAMQAPDVHIAAITAVAGNVNVQQAATNALYTAQICGKTIPVYVGADKPLMRPHLDASWFHGLDGMGEMNYPAPVRRPETRHAVDAIIETIEANPGLVLVTLGPLTNIALAVAKKPDIAAKVGRCVIMGGNPCCVGNVTPAAEYNIWVDPEAAKMVFRSGLPVELVGWHLSRDEAVWNEANIQQVLSLGTARAKFAVECNRIARKAFHTQTGQDGIALPDPTAMAVALYKDIGTSWSKHAVEVETLSDLTRGMTVVDQLNLAHDGNNKVVWAEQKRKVDICWTLDTAAFKRMLLAALG
eukprot:gene11090-11171_t